jgi:hypothetical protein
MLITKSDASALSKAAVELVAIEFIIVKLASNRSILGSNTELSQNVGIGVPKADIKVGIGFVLKASLESTMSQTGLSHER